MDISSLHQDIERLILSAKAEFANNIHDAAVQTRLKALLDLQSILKSQQLPPDQIQLIREQVSQLSNTTKTASQPTAFGYTPTSLVMAPTPHPQIPQIPQPSSAGPVLPSASTLADLLASAAKKQTVPPAPSHNPIISQHHSQTQTSQPLIGSIALSNGSQNPLIVSLRAAGMLPTVAGISIAPAPVPASTPFSYHPTPPITNTPPAQLADLVGSPLAELRNDIELTSISLKL